MILKVKGLVIKVKSTGENDKYLTILTEEHGKIFFRASGVRNLKSKYLAVTQLFSYSEFTLFQTPTFAKMNEAAIIENFYDIRLNLSSLALATYIADITSSVCVDGRDEDGILNFTLNTLYVISRKKMSDKIIKGVFEMRLMAKIGFMPNMECCEVCKDNNFDKVFFFDITGGNLLCGDCMDKSNNIGRQLTEISPDIINAVTYITKANDKRIYSFKLHDNISDEFANICEKYLLAQIDINPASLKFYKECVK